MHPAAWHPDPTGRHQFRYWDGSTWTEHVANNGVTSTDPLDSSGESSDTHHSDDVTATSIASLQHDIAELKRQLAQLAAASPGMATSTATRDPAAADLFLGDPSRNTIATAAAVVGSLAFFVAFFPVFGVLGVIAGVGAVIFGVVGRQRAKLSGQGQGRAMAGIITGSFAAVIGVLITIVLVTTVNSSGFLDEFRQFTACVEETDDVDACAEQLENGELFRLLN